MTTPRQRLKRDAEFLEQIIANPDDDGPRLIYADWLDSKGDTKLAEFIRDMIEIGVCQRESKERRAAGRLDVDYWNFRDREPLIRKKYGGVFYTYKLNDLIGLTRHIIDYKHDRGFIESVDCSMTLWEKHGPIVARQHPLKKVRIHDVVVARIPPTGLYGYPQVWAEYHRQESTIWTFPQIAQDGEPKLFGRREHAWEAMSEACIAWARSAPLRTKKQIAEYRQSQ